jgi:hypothetical protein
MRKIAAIRSWMGRLPPVQRVLAVLGMLVGFGVVALILFVFASVIIAQPWILFPSLYTKEVAVEVGDGWIKLEPATIGRTHAINFNVTNVGSEAHMVIVVYTDFAADSLPVEKGQVRSETYFDEPQFLHWFDQGGHRDQAGRGGAVTPAEGPMIAPGETSLIDYVRWGYERIPSGTTLVLFCNCPGHYERGEYATLTIE